jgi:nickel-type superoxide dismutase maturation protease
MIPTLAPGDEVLFDPRAFEKRRPQVGEIVVAHRPDRQEVVMVKRVAAITENGGIVLLGDNPGASTDSQVFGAVFPEHLEGKVTSRFA